MLTTKIKKKSSHRPFLRGVLHLYIAIILPFITITLYPFVPSLRHYHYLFRVFFIIESQCITSSILHLSRKIDPFIQALDHCFTFANVLLQYDLLRMSNDVSDPYAFDTVIGFTFFVAILQRIFRYYEKYSSMDSNDRTFLMLLGVFYIIAVCLTTWSSNLVLSIHIQLIVLSILMSFVYCYHYPNFNHGRIIGYHEVMHILSFVAICFDYVLIFI